MTTVPPGDDWGDDRLAEAFAARAAMAPATPSDLHDEVLARLSAADRGRRRWPMLAAVAVVAIGAGLAASSILAQLGPGPAGSQAVGSGNPPNTGGPKGLVLEALGDPLAVSAALAVPDAFQANREMVVSGFLSPLLPLRCLLTPRSNNPTLLRCPETSQWLMEQPEELQGGSPSGPAFHASFALVEAPIVPVPDTGGAAPLPVVVIGHFHDRRATLCDAPDREACGQTFVVDRVASVNGIELPVGTERRTDAVAYDLEQDVDAFVAVVAPDAIVVSRQLLPVEQVLAIEPVLANDLFVPFIDQSTLAWLVTAVDLRDRQPVARTFMLLDGSNWFAEITADGAIELERSAPDPSSGVRPTAPSVDPAAFTGAPASVLGMRVQGVAEVTNQRELDLATDRSEYAIRAWYLAPRPGVICMPTTPTIHAPTPPCDEARHWLFGDPHQFGVEQGQVRRDPEQWPTVLNPLVPVDVPFDVGETWRGDVPVLKAVIVLGHFNDTRVDAYAGNVFFVIDALAWTRDQTIASTDRISQLTTAATEEAGAVVARIDAVSPNDALATWTTVVEASDFATVDRWAAHEAPEFTAGAPVWIVRRLIADEEDGQPRLAVETGYTADRGTRVWWTRTPDSPPDLATSIDLHDLDGYTALLRVFDYGQTITSAGRLTGFGGLDWQRVGPVREIGLDVARGQSDGEVAIRWTGEGCDSSWRLEIREFENGGIMIQPWRSGGCEEGDRVVRQLLIKFNHPVDLDRIRTSDPCCG